MRYKRLLYSLLGILLLILAEGSILASKQFSFNKNTTKNTQDLETRCSQQTQTISKLQCWDDLVDATLSTKNGIENTFNLITNLYAQDPDFVANCHGFTHTIGQKAYILYSQGTSFKLSNQTSACGFGFYHGFMETLLTKGGNIQQAGVFCDWAGKQVPGSNDIKGACFHGIGHGLAAYHDQFSFANEDELVDSPLKVCEQVTNDPIMINRCASGVFNVMAITYASGGLAIDKQNPLKYCKTLTKPYFKKPCLEEMNTELMALTNNDFVKAAQFFNGIEIEYSGEGMRQLAAVVGNYNKQIDFDTQIRDCHNIADQLRISCITGFVGGLIEGGTPGSQDIRALSFCKNNTLKEDEHINCFQEALWQLSLYLPSEKYHGICNNIDKKYRNYCV